jgi:hypothetical protein
MTRNEPEASGGDQADAAEAQHGSMVEAEDASAQETRDERARAADAGDSEARAEQKEATHDQCPLCGFPMSEHTIDRSTANTVLNCPGPQRPAPESFEPLNEVGMVKRSPRGE